MRRLFTGFIVIVILAVGCDKYSRLDALYELNMMVDANPDSVLEVLKEMKPVLTKNDIPEESRAFYGLLLVKAADKAHKLKKELGTDSLGIDPLGADSLINGAVAYYEQHAESGHLAEAYYYAGRTNAELWNGDKALLYYHKALVKDSVHVSNRLRSRIYAQMGSLYLRNGLFADATQMGELAYFYCQQDSDTLGMRICAETIEDIRGIASEKDSSVSQDQKQLVAMKVLRMNEQLKSDLLNNRNAELQAENQKRKTMMWLIVICVLVLAGVAAWLVRRQMVEKKKLYEEMGTLNAKRREFYDAEVDSIIQNHERNDTPLKTSEWRDIETKLLASLPEFREKLFASHQFSEFEYRICILIKMGVSPSMIATLLSTSKSNISQSRQRMQQKVFNGRGSAKDWDRFILSL
jgi:tetratricopeptide (TPR) repeat protein